MLKLSAIVTFQKEKVGDDFLEDVVSAEKVKMKSNLKISLEGSVSVLPHVAPAFAPTTLNYLGHLHVLNGQYQAALAYHGKALSQQELDLAARSPYKLAIHAGDLETAKTMLQLGRVHFKLAENKSAMYWFQRAKHVEHSILGKAPHGRHA